MAEETVTVEIPATNVAEIIPDETEVDVWPILESTLAAQSEAVRLQSEMISKNSSLLEQLSLRMPENLTALLTSQQDAIQSMARTMTEAFASLTLKPQPQETVVVEPEPEKVVVPESAEAVQEVQKTPSNPDEKKLRRRKL